MKLGFSLIHSKFGDINIRTHNQDRQPPPTQTHHNRPLNKTSFVPLVDVGFCASGVELGCFAQKILNRNRT
eukprot:m.226246 g.226246  ORF g.226246 m.226246 type:complete len:71 (+) comp33487_c0_seq7:4371-4583(+)